MRRKAVSTLRWIAGALDACAKSFEGPSEKEGHDVSTPEKRAIVARLFEEQHAQHIIGAKSTPRHQA